MSLSVGCDRVPTGVEEGAVADAERRAAAVATPDRGVTAPVDVIEPDAATAIAALEGRLSAGMPYDDLRRSVLDAGWLPIESAQCAVNVGGEARVCRLLPEVDACSADGRCAMAFGHAPSDARLAVDAAGDALRWAETGGKAELVVRRASFSAGSVRAASIPCPGSSFESFLAAFAGDAGVRDAFTRPLVVVLRHRDVGEDTVSSEVLVPAADYEGFRLRRDGAAFHVAAEDGVPDPLPTDVVLTQGVAGIERVAYQYGMSEGRAYEFQKERGCWYLAAEPVTPGS